MKSIYKKVIIGTVLITALGAGLYDMYQRTFIHTVYISDIMSDRIEPQRLIDELDEAEGMLAKFHTFTVVIDSPGGEVFLLAKMLDRILDHPAQIDMHVVGLAASAAALLAFSGDTVKLHRYTRVMVHLARTYNPMTGEITILPLNHPVQAVFKDMLRDTVWPYMSDDERRRVFNGEDVWLELKEVR